MEKLQYTNIFDAIVDGSSINADDFSTHADGSSTHADGSAQAADLKFRADMMLVLRSYFESQGWKQADIMLALDITQPRASELTKGKVDKFSSDKLICFLAKIGYSIKPSLTFECGQAPLFKCTTQSLKRA
ncbi:hypothetical protein CBF23_007005 [Marinomonas agarivorans]|nr:hypothetical protein CBF23_007005 [Marinomonas agarivorans]